MSDDEKTEDIERLKMSLETAVKKRDSLEGEVAGLNSSLSASGGQSVADLTAKVTNAKREIEELEDNIEMYSCTDNATITMNKVKWLKGSIKANGDPAEGRGKVRDCRNLHYAEIIK